jgi:hypothetical protein
MSVYQYYSTDFDAQQLRQYQELELKLPTCEVRYWLNGYQSGKYNSLTKLVSEHVSLQSFCSCFTMLEYFNGHMWNYATNFAEEILEEGNDNEGSVYSDHSEDTVENDTIISSLEHKEPEQQNQDYEEKISEQKDEEINNDPEQRDEEIDTDSQDSEKDASKKRIKLNNKTVISNMEEFFKKIELCIEYEKSGNQLVQSVIYKGKKIGMFINHYARLFRNGTFIHKSKFEQFIRIKQFIRLIINENLAAPYVFDTAIELCIKYEQNYKYCFSDTTVYFRTNIGKFVETYVSLYKEGRLNDTQHQKLLLIKKYAKDTKKIE